MSVDVVQPKEKPIPAPKVVTPKKTSKSAANASGPKVAPATSDVAPDTYAPAQVAAAATAESTPTWEWWLAASLLIFASVGAVVFARRYAKDEWDIVEEKE
jgi:hypothetical protein